MTRAHLGSLLGLLCSTLFALSLLTAVDLYPPWPYLEWGVFGVMFAASIGLWFQKRWGRLTLLISGIIFLWLWLGVLVGTGCAGSLIGCARHNLQSQPAVAVAYYLAKFACRAESADCYVGASFVQPVLMMLTMAVVLKPLASNHRWRGP